MTQKKMFTVVVFFPSIALPCLRYTLSKGVLCLPVLLIQTSSNIKRTLLSFLYKNLAL
jgi:hypothetical protein